MIKKCKEGHCPNCNTPYFKCDEGYNTVMTHLIRQAICSKCGEVFREVSTIKFDYMQTETIREGAKGVVKYENRYV